MPVLTTDVLTKSFNVFGLIRDHEVRGVERVEVTLLGDLSS